MCVSPEALGYPYQDSANPALLPGHARRRARGWVEIGSQTPFGRAATHARRCTGCGDVFVRLFTARGGQGNPFHLDGNNGEASTTYKYVNRILWFTLLKETVGPAHATWRRAG